MADHTPTPWRYAPDWNPCSIYPDSPGADSLATDMSEEDAAHIVRVVNSHTELVEALEAILIYAKSMEGGTMPAPVVAIRDTAHTALKKAREET